MNLACRRLIQAVVVVFLCTALSPLAQADYYEVSQPTAYFIVPAPTQSVQPHVIYRDTSGQVIPTPGNPLAQPYFSTVPTVGQPYYTQPLNVPGVPAYPNFSGAAGGPNINLQRAPSFQQRPY